VPVWNTKTKEAVQEGKLIVLGISQEQHPDRSWLFAQWKNLGWPILHDPINVMQVKGVPVEVGIDEHGIVRSYKPNLKTFDEEFLDKSFKPDGIELLSKPKEITHPNLVVLRRRAEQDRSSEAWRELGDALVLWEGATGIDKAIEAYTQALDNKSNDGDTLFRLGVCYRLRYESLQRKPTDFQTAVDYWSKALVIEPNQYIWRRRLQQYGPRLIKPYPFYDWIETATSEVRARGGQVVELKILPTGSEIAGPSDSFDAEKRDVKSPDPQGDIFRDNKSLILTEVTVVPSHVEPKGTVRVHVTFRPNEKWKAHWNNEAEPLKLWVDPRAGWKVHPQLLMAPQGNQPETSEPRHLEFEIYSSADARGKSKLNSYALYYVCEGLGGTCYFLRQDIPITITVD
jgi:hypothetical protein